MIRTKREPARSRRAMAATTSMTEAVIECVKRRPILFDLKHPDYKNMRKRDAVWYEIGVELTQDVDELKKKWKNIKDCYQKYLRTVNNPTGKVIKRSYKNWQWAQLMEFCRPHAEWSINEIDHQNEPKCSPNPPINEDSENSLQEGVSYNENKRKRTMKLSAAPSMNYLQSKKHQVISSDATDLIFLGYSNTVKTFSPMRQAVVKMRIAQVMMEEELNNLEEASSVTGPTNPSPVSLEGLSFDNQPSSSTTYSMKVEEHEPY